MHSPTLVYIPMIRSERMEIIETLAANTRYYRKQVGISQEKLANDAGLHRTYVSGIERGLINASVKNLQKIATVLEIDAYQLIEPLD